VDGADQVASARADRGRAVATRARAALAFAEPELLAAGCVQVRAWLEEDPRLADRGHWLDRIERRRAHIRSAQVERTLRQAADALEASRVTHGQLADAELPFDAAEDAEGNRHEIGQGTYQELLTSADRTLRRTAWERYADAYLAARRTMAACIAGGVKRDVFLAAARGYASSLEAAMHGTELPVDVFHNAIASFRAHLPVWHRYWRLRRRVLGLERLREYDTKAAMAAPLRVPFRQAVEWVCGAMAPLGDDYVDIMRRGALEERWVDVYPNRGKRMGAFSYGVPGTHPYVFLSYRDGVYSLSTLAHELGHAMHTHFAQESQPYPYAGYGIFAAEVASNFHQALVRAHLLERVDDADFEIAICEEAMSNFHRYLFVMPTLGRFELEVHERVERGEALGADAMGELMADLLADVYGDEVEMDRRRAGTMWAQFHTHLYTAFHSFQYLTGIAGANVVAELVREQGVPAARRYRDFIAAGSSRYPLDALRLAGIDLGSRAPIDHAYDVMEGFVVRLERLLGT
jgi:oligoendopeptidase F